MVAVEVVAVAAEEEDAADEQPSPQHLALKNWSHDGKSIHLKKIRDRGAANLSAAGLSRTASQCRYAADSPTTNPTTYQSQRAFDKPETAVTTLADAVKTRDTNALDDIFGPEGRAVLTSGDPVADKNAREVFTVAFAEQWKLVDDGTDKKELVIGDEQWPFPIPLQKDSHGWWFDTAAGKEEVRARRIGRNELATIGICRKYADAQHAYANECHDGKPAGIFAQKVHSDDGKHNGLYWPRAQGDSTSSPLGEFAARPTKER